MRVNENPLLLELHHLSRALPPFLAAAHTAWGETRLWGCAGGVTSGGPVSPGCLVLGASGPPGSLLSPVPGVHVLGSVGAAAAGSTAILCSGVGEGLVILLPALLQIDLL